MYFIALIQTQVLSQTRHETMARTTTVSQLSVLFMFTYQVNWLHSVVKDKTGPGYFNKGAPERQEPCSAWLGVEPQTDTTGSRNKHKIGRAHV